MDLRTIEPRPEAAAFAARWGRDPRQVEVVPPQAVRVVRMDNGVIIAETLHGFVLANAGVDASNVGPSSGQVVLLLPDDADASARRIRAALEARFGIGPGVVVSDSLGRPWRFGITDLAIGSAGFRPLEDLRGTPDADGRRMAATVRAVADEIASAAELVLGKSARRPAALVRARPRPRRRERPLRRPHARGDGPLPLTARRGGRCTLASGHLAASRSLQPVKIGLQLNRFDYAGGTPAIGPTLARVVQEADLAGFDSLWVMDHFFQIRGIGPAEDPMLEGWTTLGYFAALTRRARWG